MLGLLGMKEKDQGPAGTKTEKDNSNKKGIHRCASSRRKFRENVSPLLDAGDNLIICSVEKAEVHNAFSVSVFTSKDSSNLCVY